MERTTARAIQGGMNMSMISELVRELRMADNPVGGYYRTLYARAADAIEELSAKLTTANMERSTVYYNDGWIPCSECPPEEPCFYTVEDRSPYTLERHGKPRRKVVTVKPYMWDVYDHIVAWKPIDMEPYKGVE